MKSKRIVQEKATRPGKPDIVTHRPAFTDGNAPAPAVVAVDAQPKAGDGATPWREVGEQFLYRNYAMRDRMNFKR